MATLYDFLQLISHSGRVLFGTTTDNGVDAIQVAGGAAITTLIAYTFSSLVTWYYSFKELKFKIEWQFIFKSILASILMTLLITWLNPMGLFKTMFAVVLGVLIYLILIFLLKCFNKKEMDFLKKF